MTKKSDLPEDLRALTTKMFVAAITPLDNELGHFPNCGYTDEKPNCGCEAAGFMIHQAIIDAVALSIPKEAS